MPNGSAALAFAALLGGAVILDYGVKNTRGAFASSPSPVANSPTVTVAPGGAKYGQVTYNQVDAIGKSKGWTQQQINDWFYHLIPSESNGTITDTNPTTKAYGIAQGIDGPGWYAAHGGDATTVTGQLTAMANYIEVRYKNPSAAWAFHQQKNYY